MNFYHFITPVKNTVKVRKLFLFILAVKKPKKPRKPPVLAKYKYGSIKEAMEDVRIVLFFLIVFL